MCKETWPNAPTENLFTLSICVTHIINLQCWKHRLRRRKEMAILKRAKRLWTVLTTEEVFHEDGTSERRAMVRRSSRI